MDKIIYEKITIDDNWMLVTQALIDKQAEIIDGYNDLSKIFEQVKKLYWMKDK